MTPPGPLRRPARTAQHTSPWAFFCGACQSPPRQELPALCTHQLEVSGVPHRAFDIFFKSPCSKPSSLLALTAPPKILRDQRVIMTKHGTCPLCSGSSQLGVAFAICVSKGRVQHGCDVTILMNSDAQNIPSTRQANRSEVGISTLLLPFFRITWSFQVKEIPNRDSPTRPKVCQAPPKPGLAAGSTSPTPLGSHLGTGKMQHTGGSFFRIAPSLPQAMVARTSCLLRHNGRLHPCMTRHDTTS